MLIGHAIVNMLCASISGLRHDTALRACYGTLSCCECTSTIGFATRHRVANLLRTSISEFATRNRVRTCHNLLLRDQPQCSTASRPFSTQPRYNLPSRHRVENPLASSHCLPTRDQLKRHRVTILLHATVSRTFSTHRVRSLLHATAYGGAVVS